MPAAQGRSVFEQRAQRRAPGQALLMPFPLVVLLLVAAQCGLPSTITHPGGHTVKFSAASTAWRVDVSFGAPRAPGNATCQRTELAEAEFVVPACRCMQLGEPTLWLQQQQPRKCERAKGASRCPMHSCVHRHTEVRATARTSFSPATPEVRSNTGQDVKAAKKGARGVGCGLRPYQSGKRGVVHCGVKVLGMAQSLLLKDKPCILAVTAICNLL